MTEWRGRIRWFAAEFLVVVTGVLVALGLQSFYERTQDERRETAYLRQLVNELHATEATMITAESFTASGDRAGVMLLRAYRGASPQDSILVWLNGIGRFSFHLPITGTVEALVSSGDLRLIENDSLRAAITTYVGNMRPILQTLQNATEIWQRSIQDLGEVVDLNEAASLMPNAASIKLRDSVYSPLPKAPRRPGFEVNINQLLSDRTAYAALDRMNSAKYIAYLMRVRILEEARMLREGVEAELAGRQGPAF